MMTRRNLAGTSISRRLAVVGTATGLGIGVTTGLSSGVMGKVTPEPVTPVPLRSGMTRVLIVQGTPEQVSLSGMPFGQEDPVSAIINSMTSSIGGADLVVLGDDQRIDLDARSSSVAALAECAADINGYIVVRTGGPSGSILFSPDAAPRVLTHNEVNIVATPIGTLAFVPDQDARFEPELLSHRGTDMVIRHEASEYTRQDIQRQSVKGGWYSIVHTPVRSAVNTTAPATAIIGPDGQVLTTVGASWTQAITARLPIQLLRRRRASHSAGMA